MTKRPKSEKPEPFKPQFPGQHPEETVRLVFHQHPLVMRIPLIVGLLLILASLMPPLWWPLADWAWNPLWFTLVFVAFYWFHRWFGWYYSVYIATSERLIVIKQRGFFNRQFSEYSYDILQNVNYHVKGFQAVIFQFGDITAQTYVGDVVMRMIYRPELIHGQLIAIVRESTQVAPPGL
jgi:hypothetical protein